MHVEVNRARFVVAAFPLKIFQIVLLEINYITLFVDVIRYRFDLASCYSARAVSEQEQIVGGSCGVIFIARLFLLAGRLCFGKLFHRNAVPVGLVALLLLPALPPRTRISALF